MVALFCGPCFGPVPYFEKGVMEWETSHTFPKIDLLRKIKTIFGKEAGARKKLHRASKKIKGLFWGGLHYAWDSSFCVSGYKFRLPFLYVRQAVSGASSNRRSEKKKKGKSASLPFSGKGKVRWQFQIKPTTDPITFPFSLLRERKRQFFFFNLYFVVQNKTETENLI